MYKSIFLLLLALSLFLACGDDDTTSFSAADLHGSWVYTDSPHPGTPVTTYNADGTWTKYSNYAMTMVSDNGGWAFSNSVLIESNSIYTADIDLAMINADRLQWVLGYMYRRGSVPMGAGAATATAITPGPVYSSNYQPQGETKWFSFEASASALYSVFIDDATSSTPGYDGDVKVTIVAADMTTLYSIQLDRDLVNNPVNIAPAENGYIYIIVEEASIFSDGNAFGIKVGVTG